LTSVWGDPFTNSSVSVGDIIEKNVSIKLSKLWKPKNCEIIVFISNAETKEIYQSEMESVLSK
jgi:hypothetical protein